MKTNKALPPMDHLDMWQKMKKLYPETIIFINHEGILTTYGGDAETVCRLCNGKLNAGSAIPCFECLAIALDRLIRIVTRANYKVGVCEEVPEEKPIFNKN